MLLFKDMLLISGTIKGKRLLGLYQQFPHQSLTLASRMDPVSQKKKGKKEQKENRRERKTMNTRIYTQLHTHILSLFRNTH